MPAASPDELRPRNRPPSPATGLSAPAAPSAPTGIPSDSSRPPRTWAICLFLLTALSTFYVQFRSQRDPRRGQPDVAEVIWGLTDWELSNSIRHGLTYAGCLMAILGAHEFGHYLQARRHGIPAGLPIFIPLPMNQLGTMGALVQQKSGHASRRILFDIAISGPLAGLAFAIPICCLGMIFAERGSTESLPAGAELMVYHGPPLLKALKQVVHGDLPKGTDILMNPALLAGWFGILITAVNLIPIGQLDGGHILYCLIGRRANTLARLLFLSAAVAVGILVIQGERSYLIWWLMLILLWLMGIEHAPTADDRAPLGWGRTVLGWLTLLFMLAGMTLHPFELIPGVAPGPGPSGQEATEGRASTSGGAQGVPIGDPNARQHRPDDA
ncbi:MAG: site-2 protease family protein [Planctomycetes bacterium]|nr:site-2 protease family protein [Planctomycetota bacterium]